MGNNVATISQMINGSYRQLPMHKIVMRVSMRIMSHAVEGQHWNLDNNRSNTEETYSLHFVSIYNLTSINLTNYNVSLSEQK